MIKVGQKLYEERVKRNLTIEDISSATKIRASFIEAIEKGEYHKLPSSSYVQGFVRNYVKFLNLPEKETMAVFRREFDAKKTFRVLPEGLARNEEFTIHRFKLRQTFVVALVFFAILFLYILFQYRYAIINPPLNISYPPEGAVISGESVVISGRTNPDSTIYVNDEAVVVDEEGNFKKEVDLFQGENKIVIKSVNRFSRQTSITRQIRVR